VAAKACSARLGEQTERTWWRWPLPQQTSFPAISDLSRVVQKKFH